MSTSPPYKHDESGLTLAQISKSMTLYSSARRTHHGATDLSLESLKSTLVPTDDLALSNCWYARRRSYDLFPRSASSNITNNFNVNPCLLLSLLLLIITLLSLLILFITFLSLRISHYCFSLDTYFSLYLSLYLIKCCLVQAFRGRCTISVATLCLTRIVCTALSGPRSCVYATLQSIVNLIV